MMQAYPEEDILKAKIDLLGKTNMVDYGMDIHKALYRTEDVPEGAASSTATFLSWASFCDHCSASSEPPFAGNCSPSFSVVVVGVLSGSAR